MPLKTNIAYVVESDQGSSALHSHTVSETFTKRVDANRQFKAMRKKWCYVRLYRTETVKTLVRVAKY